MSKLNWDRKIKIVENVIAHSTKTDELIAQLFKHLSPSQYSPFIEDVKINSLLEILSDGDEGLKNWLEYYFYEASAMLTKKVNVECNGKKYDFKSRISFIRFLNTEYASKT